MATTEERLQESEAVYQLEGTLLEACSCGILCPCWVGEDPDGGECFAFIAYNFTSGQIRGVDVSGLTLVNVVHAPGNVLIPESWEVVRLVDERASEEQREALIALWDGAHGGPLADLAGLVGDVRGVEYVPIRHELVGGEGRVVSPGILEAEMSPYRGPDGTVTTLRDSIFSTVPGSPAWVGKTSRYKVNLPQYGWAWEYEGRNAIQSKWRIEHRG